MSFPWHRARWDFRQSQGPFLHDQSGRGHDLEIPRSGYTQEFFGLEWDGTTHMAIADHPDFAVTNGPLMLEFDATRVSEQQTTLIKQVDANRTLAWRLSLEPDRRIRFTIGDGRGSFSTIEGPLPAVDTKGGSLNGFRLYAIYDVRTGEQLLYENCHLLASGTSKLKIPKHLGPDARVAVLEGFRGIADSFSIENARMEPSDPTGKSCGMSGRDLDVSDD